MKINKVLNNNVIIAIDEKSEEIILMGLGLGFGKKTGDFVDPKRIEKTFKLEVTDDKQNFTDILEEIPSEIIELSIITITEAKDKINQEFSDSVLISFADHLNAAINRVKQNIEIKNFLLWDIKKFFPVEFEICKKTLAKVNALCGVQLPEDEAGFLAMNIINGTLGSGNDYSTKLTKLMEEILTTLKYTLKINFDDQDVYFQRFIMHLKFFTERILSNTKLEDTIDDDLYHLILKKYPLAYIGTSKVCEYLFRTQAYVVSQSEKIYMTIHLARILEKIQTH